MRARALALVGAGSALALAATAGSAAAQPGVLAPLQNRAPTSTTFTDRVLDGSDAPRLRAATPRAATRRLTTPDGYRIPVRVSRNLTGDPAIAQSYVNFLSTLPHGSELGRLKLDILPGADVNAACGGDATAGPALACYDGSSETMIVPGDRQDSGDGVTASYVITHEYGHHVARNRSNSPFSALHYGPKRWSSYENVCSLTHHGRLFPGDERSHYTRNPGESWAETYARLVYPDHPWTFTSLLTPDPGALAAARADVFQPWSHRRTKTFKGRIPAGKNRATIHLPVTLDGTFSLHLSGPSRTNYDLRVRNGGRTFARTHAHGSRDRARIAEACRSGPTATLALDVLRESGRRGSFRIKAYYAG